MKGIVLAGGSGTRLHPITLGISKQLIPVYDKPMIYYPISILLLAGINKILIISTKEDILNYKNLLGDGQRFGVSFSYAIQKKPEGLAQALTIGKSFIGNDSVCLVLGDNIFYGQGLTKLLYTAIENAEKHKKATVFGYYVENPSEFGVVEFDISGNAISIEEKPKNPKSNYAVVGLYFYPNNAIKIAEKIKPSKRGELEISSVNQQYLNNNDLKVELLKRGFAWLDTGTHDSLSDASTFIKTVENRQGFKIACLEEISMNKGYISKEQVLKIGEGMQKTNYGQYLIKISTQ